MREKRAVGCCSMLQSTATIPSHCIQARPSLDHHMRVPECRSCLVLSRRTEKRKSARNVVVDVYDVLAVGFARGRDSVVSAVVEQRQHTATPTERASTLRTPAESRRRGLRRGTGGYASQIAWAVDDVVDADDVYHDHGSAGDDDVEKEENDADVGADDDDAVAASCSDSAARVDAVD